MSSFSAILSFLFLLFASSGCVPCPFIHVVLGSVSHIFLSDGGILTVQDNAPDSALPSSIFYFQATANESIPQNNLELPGGSWSFPVEPDQLCADENITDCPITDFSVSAWFVVSSPGFTYSSV